MTKAEQARAYEERKTLQARDGIMYKQEPLGVYYILTIFTDPALRDGFYSHLTYTAQVPSLDDLEILDI